MWKWNILTEGFVGIKDFLKGEKADGTRGKER